MHFMKKKSNSCRSDIRFVGWNLVLAVVLGLSLITGLVFWLRSYTEHGIEVEVEDVRGMVQAEAEPILAAKGLKLIVVDSTYTEKVPFGTIVEQDPKPASHAKHGRAVYVTINATGKRQIVMPNLQDMSYRQAETTLRGLGIIVDSVYEYEPSAFRDLVLDVRMDSLSIAPGEKIEVGSTVRLVVGFGKGTDMVTVPTVVGLTLRDARSLLLRKRLTVGAVNYDEEEIEEGAERYIYRQEPNAGEKLLEGEIVTLWLSTNIEKVVSGGDDNTDDDGNWF